MSSVKHILVPTDGSEHSLKAAGFAGDLARDTGARVSVLIVHRDDVVMPHVWGVGEWPVMAGEINVSAESIRESVEQHASDNELAATVKALGKLATDAAVLQCWGQAAEEICRHAVDNAVDLIVIGSRGRSAFANLLLGSVASQVASHATCPVTIVH